MEPKNYFDTLDVNENWRNIFTHHVFGYRLSKKHKFFQYYPLVDRTRLKHVRLWVAKHIQSYPCYMKPNSEPKDAYCFFALPSGSPHNACIALTQTRDYCKFPDVKRIIDDLLTSSYIEKLEKFYNDHEIPKNTDHIDKKHKSE
jgi:hypothetical protein